MEYAVQRNFSQSLLPEVDLMARFDRRESEEFQDLNKQMIRVRHFMMRNSTKFTKAREALKSRKEADRKLKKLADKRNKTALEDDSEKPQTGLWGNSLQNSRKNLKKALSSKENDSDKHSNGIVSGVSSVSGEGSQSNSIISYNSPGRDLQKVLPCDTVP
jgi:hypothetical protein